MTIKLTDRRPTVRLTDRWEENHRPFDLNRREETASTQPKEGRSRCVNPERKKEAEGKSTEGRRKQRGKMRNLRVPTERIREERNKIKQSPAEYLKLKT